MASRYDHTQVGFAIIAVVGAVMLIEVWVFGVRGWNAISAIVVGLTALVGVLFGSLRVVVDDDCIQLRFGPGLIRRSIDLADVTAAEPVRNPWWYGFGIRRTRHGWMWNVSQLGAVQLTLADGRGFRIGSDELERLAAAVRSAIQRPSQRRGHS